jgi:hypothetical protein
MQMHESMRRLLGKEKEFTDVELEKARENIKRYVLLVLRVCERLEREKIPSPEESKGQNENIKT